MWRVPWLAIACLCGCGPERGATVATPVPPSTGPREAHEIRGVVRANIEDIRACVQRGSLADPNLRGRVTVHFVISEAGIVTRADIFDSELPERSQPTEDCVVAAVRGWRFPERRGIPEADVVYPFVLAVARPVHSASGLVAGRQRIGQWFTVPRRPGGTVVVEVQSGRDRDVLAGIGVELVLDERDGRQTLRAVTDRDGRATFAGLPRGATIKVRLESDDTAVSEPTPIRAGAIGTILVDERTEPGAP